MSDLVACPMCALPFTREVLARARTWRFWEREDGACPACVQEALLRTLLAGGRAALHEAVQTAWPLDAEAAFGALPTPLRLHADARFRGAGTVIAMVDSAFAPHADLTQPHNRIRAWVDASGDDVDARSFAPDEVPAWPGSGDASGAQWHGTMTSVVAAGNGYLAHGLYRGLASEAEVVLIQVRDRDGRITNESIERALRWLERSAAEYGVRVVNLSVSGDWTGSPAPNPIDDAIARLAAQGIVVVAAAGNEGVRSLVPPATAPAVITVGGIDDMNTFDPDALALWHSNYGPASDGAPKPELVAPSIWVAAPVLPGSRQANEAQLLFDRRMAGESVHSEIDARKLITPHYQHADGTSFAAPIVASTVACMLEANPLLTPALVRDLLRGTASRVPGAPIERQGAGALEAGRAVAAALHEPHGALPASPELDRGAVRFQLHDHGARHVRVVGSWNDWASPGLACAAVRSGWWQTEFRTLPPGRHTYKFVIDDVAWIDDPANRSKEPDGFGGFNSVVSIQDGNGLVSRAGAGC